MNQHDISASDEAGSASTSQTPSIGSRIDPATLKVPRREDPPPSIRLTRFSGPPDSRLTKTFSLGQDGRIEKSGTPAFAEGVAETIELASVQDLPPIIDALGSNQCLATGVFDQKTCRIVPKDRLNAPALAAGVRSRSKEHMTQPTPGLILLDHDPSPDMPEPLRCAQPDELMAKLTMAIAPFARVAYVGAGSCSSGICTPNTPPSVPGGLHVYVVYAGDDLARLRGALEIKLWNGGLGYIGFARNGGLLVKTIIDLSVMSQERIIYEARPMLGDGLTQHPRVWHRRPGDNLAGDLSVTPEEQQEYRERVRAAKAAPDVQARARRLETAYIDQQGTALAEHRGIDRVEAKALLTRAGEPGVLPPDHLLEIHGQTLTASELLARGEEFDQVAMPDPIEGRDYGATTAKFYYNGGIDPCIHSFAHGLNRVYRFKRRASEPTYDLSQPLDPTRFPNVKHNRVGTPYLPATISNFEHMLDQYSITVQFNVIKKQLDILIPELKGTPENYRSTALTHLVSLANLNGISVGQIESFVAAIADRHPSNPVADWIRSRPWDCVDRLPAIFATLTTRQGFPAELKDAVMHRWLLSAVAAAIWPKFHCRGVLTLQGPQRIGKTSWIRILVPHPMLGEDVVLLGHHLDVADKDSKVTAISHWIVELGELDSSFKKDVARLKGFITATHDKVRRPYGKADSEYPRRTVFCATVNEDTFLVDPTGNSRWWTLPVVKIDYAHRIDMQQLFAQLAVELEAGAEWWLTKELEDELETQNSHHTAASIVEEKVLALLDLDRPDEAWSYHSASEILEFAGIRNPNNAQARECGTVLRRLFGPPKKVQGLMKWRVPVRRNQFAAD